MKFEQLLMETGHQHCQKHDLQQSVMSLDGELGHEQAIHKALRAAVNGTVLSQPRLTFSLLPPQVQELITEIATVEAEILRLDRQIQELKLDLYQEQIQNQEMQMSLVSEQQEQRRVLTRQNHVRHDLHHRSMSQYYRRAPRDSASAHSRFSFAYASSDFFNATSTGFTDELDKLSRMQVTKGIQIVEAKIKDDPNDVSEQLIRCLIGIYLEMNQVSPGKAEGDVVPKRQSLPHSRRQSFSRKANTYTCYYQNTLNLDPYRILSDSSGVIRDVGPYNNFIHITKSSLDVSSFTHYCSPAVPRLRVLMEKLAEVELSFLTYKQKLAFWINIYNACVMNAFLEHGLPSSHNKLLTLMNKASLNVGGIVLNALAIEHFILRHPGEPEHGLNNEKETLLRHAYGLGYSEPNVTFALCRGNWSSPALRVYTPDNVVNDLGRARVEYLEASVGVSSKKRIVIPQLLQWNMKDFADDMESLLEWIYSQLPRSGSLKGMMMECLKRKAKTPLTKMVEIQTYRDEFRYLLSL
ncbi:PREDICTED: uncharacterized protein LOC104824281 isoform X2 [Tarenaya hassleriana]|uniref:uncharacterized protein LOC104824281 isoform X2 n=1 Tax=Tarenaya hassleriana TaxID=28532 RepID=UPI00053CA279|nr:PREDICTED: uncharacterized protein LOC104824281 isoform X2 [Tarenaya hassleriana]